MQETVEEDINKKIEEDSISQSVENLSDLSQKVESIKTRKQNNLDSSETEDVKNKPYFTGVIVPGPDSEDTKTGEICGGEVCVWIENKKTGDQFSEWLDYPTSKNKYNKSNEYIRLCKHLGIETDNPEDMLYQEVPVHEEYGGLHSKLHLPDYGTKTSVIKHKTSRTLNNYIEKIKNTKSLMVFLNLTIYYFIIKNTLVSFPSFIPTSGEESLALGYSNAEGFSIFFIFCMFIFVISLLNIKISSEYIPEFVNEIYNTIISKINKSLDSEYIE